jgi:hypothetical protein
VTVSVGPSMKRGFCAVLMVSLRGVVMMPLSWLEVCVSDPIFAYSHCRLETNSVEMLAAQSPRTSPGGALRNMFGLLLRLYYGQRRWHARDLQFAYFSESAARCEASAEPVMEWLAMHHHVEG